MPTSRTCPDPVRRNRSYRRQNRLDKPVILSPSPQNPGPSAASRRKKKSTEAQPTKFRETNSTKRSQDDSIHCDINMLRELLHIGRSLSRGENQRQTDTRAGRSRLVAGPFLLKPPPALTAPAPAARPTAVQATSTPASQPRLEPLLRNEPKMDVSFLVSTSWNHMTRGVQPQSEYTPARCDPTRHKARSARGIGAIHEASSRSLGPSASASIGRRARPMPYTRDHGRRAAEKDK